MRALNHKMLRDLWHMRGQALAIAVVIGAGLATVVMSLSTLDSLHQTRLRYYQDYGFPEVFASLKRAPEALAGRISELPGVARLQTRVVAPVSLDIRGFPEPATGELVSVPSAGDAALNRLYLREGRFIEPGRGDEILVNEVFAESHGFRPGDHLGVIIKGHKRRFTIVGTVLAPEYIYQIAPGAVFPDFVRYAALWTDRRTLETAYDMDGAFNNVTLTLVPGAQIEDVIAQLDYLLEPYGGFGAFGRKDHVSHRFLSEEFKQLEQMARTFSVIFLGIAVFLLNMVITRLVATQREQIAALKAFGYSNLAVGLHYAGLVSLIVLIGIVAGVAAGVWLGHGLADLYMDYYRFPYLAFELRPALAVGTALLTLLGALAGTLYSVRRAALLPPAEAMRPEPPATYRATLVERAGLQRWLSQPSRMILRDLERRPLKALLSVTGIALACAVMMLGTFFNDAVDYMVEVEFQMAQREDMAVTFVEPSSRRAIFELDSLPGVTRVEPFRGVPVRLRAEHRSYRTAIQGYEPGATLRRTLDVNLRPIELPTEGVVLTDYLGKILQVGPGDTLTVEVLEGNRPHRQVVVAALVKQYIGVGAYMDLAALNRLMREAPSISGAFLAADRPQRELIYQRLKETPRVAGTEVSEYVIRNYYATIGDLMLTFVTFISALAVAITFGVVYNSARITLSERSREMASLRVLGLTRGEISWVLLGELALLTLLAIPMGFALGYWLCWWFAQTVQQDLFRVPVIVEPATYTLAAVVVLGSALVSGLIVRRRLDHLDLVAVLKTRE